MKSWPPGGGAVESGATWVWPLSVTFGASAAFGGSGFAGSAFAGSGAGGIVDGVVTGALDAGPAPPFAGIVAVACRDQYRGEQKGTHFGPHHAT